MIKKIKAYFEYIRNIKTVKRELVKTSAAALPVISTFVESKADMLNFINNLITSTKSLEGEELVKIVLDEIATKLMTDHTRLIEILSYMARLSPEDIQKVLAHSAVDSMVTDRQEN